jgi:hypothetical protein
MSPEELPRPKGPKVEPIDRRGKRMLELKAKLSNHAENSPADAEPINESPAQRLERICADPGASLKEIREILLYFLPHVELIEIEMMLARCLAITPANPTDHGEHLPRFHQLLLEVNNREIIPSKTYQLAHEVRKMRNGLFHKNQQLTDINKQSIKELWRVLEKVVSEFESLSQEVDAAVDFGLKDVARAQKTANKLLAIAYLIEIEQELKHVMDELMVQDDVLKNIFIRYDEQPGNAQFLKAILSSNSDIYGAFKRLHFIDDLKLTVRKRHELIHPREINDCPPETLSRIARIWGALRSRKEILNFDEALLKIESQLRLFLQANGTSAAATEDIRTQKLVKIACGDQTLIHRLNSAKVGRKMLLGLSDLYIEIFDGTLQPPTAQSNKEWLHVLSGIQAATETSLVINSQSFEVNRKSPTKKSGSRSRRNNSQEIDRREAEDID